MRIFGIIAATALGISAVAADGMKKRTVKPTPPEVRMHYTVQILIW